MAYKHSRWQNERSDEDSYENIKIEERYDTQNNENNDEEESIFLKPPQQIGNVIAVLDDYLRNLQDMKISKRELLRTVVELCPYSWPNMHELCIYLDDQAEIWEVACDYMKSFSYRLKEYESQIEEARVALEVYRSRQTELFNMSEEYAKMQKAGRIPKVQSNQIKFMVAESERAMALIKADTERKLLNFKKSQVEIGKEFLDKFQETMHMTYTESLQINEMIKAILGNIPSRKLNVFGQPRDDVEFVVNIMEKTKAKAKAASNKETLVSMGPRNRGDTRVEESLFTASKCRTENKNSITDSRYYKEQTSVSYTDKSKEQHLQNRSSVGYSTVTQDKARAVSAASPNRQSVEQTRPASSTSPQRQYYACSPKDTSQIRVIPVQAIDQEPAGERKISFKQDYSQQDSQGREPRERTKTNTTDPRDRSEDDAQRRLPYRTRPLQEEPRTPVNRDHSPYRYMYHDITGVDDINYGKAAQEKHQFYENCMKQPDKDSRRPFQRWESDQRSPQDGNSGDKESKRPYQTWESDHVLSQDVKSGNTANPNPVQTSGYYRRRY